MTLKLKGVGQDTTSTHWRSGSHTQTTSTHWRSFPRPTDVIVGSSRGGAIAVNIDSRDTPLVLLCPAWKNWGRATKLKSNAVILHSLQDDVIPYSDSSELVANSNLPLETLIAVGNDHRLATKEPLRAMLESCERVSKKQFQSGSTNSKMSF